MTPGDVPVQSSHTCTLSMCQIAKNMSGLSTSRLTDLPRTFFYHPQVVSNIRGGRHSTQQQDPQQQVYLQAYSGPANSSTAAPADLSDNWSSAADIASQDRYQQQQGHMFNAAGVSGAATAAATPGPPPLLNFRSDKAFMTADEMERRQRAQLELQKALDQQIQEKKRRKVCADYFTDRQQVAGPTPMSLLMYSMCADCHVVLGPTLHH